ncbi:MAG TPA: mechanosensitive ion channel family protein [Stellaceae bacterium]|nr:mechanosensitive ion channel family protein [Stellaceae bacterium]
MNFLGHLFGIVPHWVVGIAIMVVPALVVLALYRWFMGRIIRLAGRFSPFLMELLTRGHGPASMLVLILALGATLPAAQFSARLTSGLAGGLLAALVLAIGWAAMKALETAADFYLRRFHTDVADNLLARKHVTQVNILRRTAQTLLVIITIAAALMTVQQVRQYGVSLFASAGAAGIILGLAARPVLSNLLAGIQIAITQPIRVEDAVIVEGQWGWIEKITSTYVVVRIWNLQRMILPISYFIEKPFQNWTYESARLIGTVGLHVDYTTPTDAVRQKLDEIVKASKLWDGEVAVMQVIEALPTTMELRVLVSARNAGEAWDLRCEVREKLIGFLQAEYPHALPHQRAEIVGAAGFLSAEPEAGAPPGARRGAMRRGTAPAEAMPTDSA